MSFELLLVILAGIFLFGFLGAICSALATYLKAKALYLNALAFYWNSLAWTLLQRNKNEVPRTPEELREHFKVWPGKAPEKPNDPNPE
jgi:hypothetical protein